MALINSQNGFIHCATCQFWNGDRQASKTFSQTVNVRMLGDKGICTNPRQAHYKGKEVLATHNNCVYYQPWDQLKT